MFTNSPVSKNETYSRKRFEKFQPSLFYFQFVLYYFVIAKRLVNCLLFIYIVKLRLHSPYRKVGNKNSYQKCLLVDRLSN